MVKSRIWVRILSRDVLCIPPIRIPWHPFLREAFVWGWGLEHRRGDTGRSLGGCAEIGERDP